MNILTMLGVLAVGLIILIFFPGVLSILPGILRLLIRRLPELVGAGVCVALILWVMGNDPSGDVRRYLWLALPIFVFFGASFGREFFNRHFGKNGQ